jgi:putative chitinase
MIIKIGSTGENVKKIQIKLGIKDSGIFGPKTDEAVKKWQKANGLLDDGIVGKLTWSKMFDTPTQINEDVVLLTNNTIDITRLNGHIPKNVISQIPMVIEKFEINTPLRLSHFLSQCAHESGGFRAVQENLNYSVSGLMSTFSRYFPSKTIAEQYARNPEKIASKVYGGRMGNGNENTKEGWKFRGRGYIQLTGKSNYSDFNKFVDDDIVENPDLVATKYPLLSAAWFFHKNCLSRCDAGSNDSVITSVTRCVNGGTNGLEDRKKYFKQYYELLS